MALVLLSLNMMGLRERHLVSSGQRVAAKLLPAACPVLLVLTLLSLFLALLPGTGSVYLYVGLGFVTVVTPSAAGAHCYLRHRAAARRGGDGGEAATAASDEEDKSELDAASKITSGVTYSALGGTVGVLFSVQKISAAAKAPGGAVLGAAANSAIFFLFATSILGLFVMTAAKIVPEARDLPCRRFLVTGVRLANAFLLCMLACAAFAASFGMLRWRVFAAFAPLLVTAAISFLLRHCVARRHGGENHEARIKAMEDTASKVMVGALAGIMTILGGWLGEEDHAKWGVLDTSLVLVTSVFVSSFGFMVLAAAPLGSARERLAPVASRVLIWSTAALFAATAVAVYGLEVSGAA